MKVNKTEHCGIKQAISASKRVDYYIQSLIGCLVLYFLHQSKISFVIRSRNGRLRYHRNGSSRGSRGHTGDDLSLLVKPVGNLDLEPLLECKLDVIPVQSIRASVFCKAASELDNIFDHLIS